MLTLRALRRLALGSVAALAILPLTAATATASGHDDLCALQEDAPESFEPLLEALSPIIEAVCEEDGEGDDGDDDGDGPSLDDLLEQLDPDALEELLGQLPIDDLCALRDEAPEEFAPLLEALEALTDLVCEDGDPEPEPEPEAEEPVDEDEGEAQPQVEEEAASSTPTLPNTGGGAALAGIALLGAAGAVRRLVSLRS
jgi:hypothetical protein